jgi:hypothetical protein
LCIIKKHFGKKTQNKRKGRENKTLLFCFGLIIKLIHTLPEKQEFFENGFDLLLFFDIYYVRRGNHDCTQE